MPIGNARRATGAIRRKFSLSAIETLEERCCPTVSVATSPMAGGTKLTIVSDKMADTIVINDQGNGHIDVRDGVGRLLGSANNVRSLLLDTGAGADKITYTLLNTLTQSELITMRLGDGAGDFATLDFSKGVKQADLWLVVLGGSGNDSVTATVGLISQGSANVYMNGGAGNDRLVAGDPVANLDASSRLSLDVTGGSGNDSIDVAATGVFDGGIFLRAFGETGIDTVAVNLQAAEGSTGGATLLSSGGTEADTVKLYANDYSNDGGPSTLKFLHSILFNPGNVDKLIDKTPNTQIDTLPHTANYLPSLLNSFTRLGQKA